MTEQITDARAIEILGRLREALASALLSMQDRFAAAQALDHVAARLRTLSEPACDICNGEGSGGGVDGDCAACRGIGRTALSEQQGEALDRYDAGLLGDFGGGNVEWWQDYIRAELERAHDFYESLVAPAPAPVVPEGWRLVPVDRLQLASDLLAERKQGNPARSAGHNGRLVIDALIAEAPQAEENGHVG